MGRISVCAFRQRHCVKDRQAEAVKKVRAGALGFGDMVNPPPPSSIDIFPVTGASFSIPKQYAKCRVEG
jgi:hypothetical protein